jgi:rhamnulokinase
VDHLAIDIGASGGRVIASRIVSPSREAVSAQAEIELREICRFENRPVKKRGHVYWDIDTLFAQVLRGLGEARRLGITACTVGIDTWGVDYALIDRDGARIQEVFSYRDQRTEGVLEAIEAVLPRKSIYEKTGIQFLPFNTLYQLYAHDKTELKRAHRILLIPDFLNYLLTGRAVTERTNASTTQLINLKSGDFDPDLLVLAGVRRDQFPELVDPLFSLGSLKPELRRGRNLPECEVVCVATHDTASAVAGTPLEAEDEAYVSSGTWSLLGIERPQPIVTANSLNRNFTNERGVFGTYRILKNLTGLWLVQELRSECGGCDDFEALMAKAGGCRPFRHIVNCNDPVFHNPESMSRAIGDFCRRTGQAAPESEGEFTRCALDSLALLYRRTLEEIEELAGFRAEVLRVVGGGSRNGLLNVLTADATGRRVSAGPSEATALGNLVMQMIAAGEIENLASARRLIAHAFPAVDYYPRKSEEGEAAGVPVREAWLPEIKKYEHDILSGRT